MQPIFSVYLLLLANTAAAYLLPNPPGRYNVTLTTGPLIDYSRNDSTSKPRALLLSVFEPATCASTVPVAYMPKKTAEFQGPYLKKVFKVSKNYTPLFLQARLPVCSNHPDDCSPLDDAPILLFSPGYAIPRLNYNVLASAIAAQGFRVITIDHPDDAAIITYPDGHAVTSNAYQNLTNANLAKKEHARAADASFIINQLANATAVAKLLPQRGPRPFKTDRVAMLGHSLGGAASVIAASQDSRIRGAIDWDGTVHASLPKSGVPQPVLYMQHENFTDPSWPKVFPQLKGPKLWLSVANTTHETFADVATLLKAAGQEAPELAALLGTIAPAEMVRILAAYSAAWMNGAFAGKEKELDSSKFPEVSTVRKGNFRNYLRNIL